MELNGFISLFCSFFIYWLSIIVKTTGQTDKGNTNDYKVAVGENVTLKCSIDPQEVHAMWWRHDPIVTYSVGKQLLSGDERFSLEGKYNLRIENVTLEDEGPFQCVGNKKGSPPVTIDANVVVLVPPTASIISPVEDKTEVKVNGSLKLDCKVEGKPTPSIVWTRKNMTLPNGDKFYKGNPFELTQVQYDDGGVYICSANNSLKTVTDETEISVIYPPFMDVDKEVIYSGPGFDTILTCLVSGNPTPGVTWYLGDIEIEDGGRQKQETGLPHKRKQKYTLVLRELEESDFGTYTCRANNSLGTSSHDIVLSGLPSDLRIISDPVGQYANEYFLQWTLKSYAQPLTYRLKLLKVSENSTDDWIEKTIPAEKSGVMPVERTQGYHITDLDPSSEYKVRLFVKNMFGWGDKSNKFMFKTNKAGVTPAPDGIHYEDSEGNGTVVNIDGGAEGRGYNNIFNPMLMAFMFACAYV